MKSAIVAVVLLWAGVAAGAAQWEKIGGTHEGVALLMDRNSVRQEPGGQTRAWFNFKNSKRKEDNLQLVSVDCDDRSYITLEVVMYKGGKVKGSPRPDGETERPAPGTLGETMVEAACDPDSTPSVPVIPAVVPKSRPTSVRKLRAETCQVMGSAPGMKPEITTFKGDGFSVTCPESAPGREQSCTVHLLAGNKQAGTGAKTLDIQFAVETVGDVVYMSSDNASTHVVLYMPARKFSWAQTSADLLRGGLIQKQCIGSFEDSPIAK